MCIINFIHIEKRIDVLHIVIQLSVARRARRVAGSGGGLCPGALRVT